MEPKKNRPGNTVIRILLLIGVPLLLIASFTMMLNGNTGNGVAGLVGNLNGVVDLALVNSGGSHSGGNGSGGSHGSGSGSGGGGGRTILGIAAASTQGNHQAQSEYN